MRSVIADAKRLVPLPSGADPQQLAMMTVNPATASLMLSEFVTLQPGDWVIQNVANSGVGGYLTQLAKLRGLREGWGTQEFMDSLLQRTCPTLYARGEEERPRRRPRL